MPEIDLPDVGKNVMVEAKLCTIKFPFKRPRVYLKRHMSALFQSSSDSLVSGGIKDFFFSLKFKFG